MNIQANERPASHLFYVHSALRRPLVDRAEGIYFWPEDGRRFIDGSSGPMVSNIGHGNRHVIDAMKKQMDKVSFAYRLHFENEPAEELARRLAGNAGRSRSYVLRIGWFGSGGILAIKLARQWAVATNQAGALKVISRRPPITAARWARSA